MVNIGEQLLQPEEGYQRISLASSPNKEKCIITNLQAYSHRDYAYNGYAFFDIVKADPSSITFYINSKKFRFISKVDYEAEAKDSVKVIFDDKEYVLADQYQNGKIVKGLILQADKTFDTSLHKITISSENKGYMWVDCIDIDTDGSLLSEEEYINIKMSPRYLIQDNINNKIYNYNEENNTLIELQDISILANEDTATTCIYDLNKILSLIDLTTPGIKIICNKPVNHIVNAIKNDKEMIISTQNLSLLSAEKINTIKQVVTKSNNGNCKTVFSLDNGITWKSYDTSNSQFIDLTNTFPLDDIDNLDPNNLSEENKTKWNNLQDEIIEKGIDADTMQTLDFATLLGDTYKNIRFAHVLIRPTYDDKITLQNISWDIDKKGRWHQLSPNDVDISIDSNSCEIVAKNNDMQNVKLNILI